MNDSSPERPPSTDHRTRVAFLCYANACRSQMAEAYARALGSDVIEPLSAGVSPLGHIPSEVAEVMQEEGISIEGQHSKSLWDLKGGTIDLIVDLAGVLNQSASGVPIDSRPVVDPFGGELDDYRTTRDAVRAEVEALIEDFRVRKPKG